MEQFVVQFPAFAAWALVSIGSLTLILAAFGGRQFLKRLDVQDKTMADIHTLLESETKQLRELSHAQDKRLIALEEWRRFNEALATKQPPR